MSSGGHSFHKKDWLKVGAGVGLAAAAPFVLPELGAAMGLGGAEAGGAGLLGDAAVGGAAAGAGGTAAGTAGMFGAAPGFAGSLLAPEAAGPLFTGGGEALGSSSLLGAGGFSPFGGSPEGLEMMSAIQGAGSSPSVSSMLSGMNWKNGLQGLQKAQQLSQLSGQQQHVQAQRPASYQGGGNELAQLSALYSNPAGKEALMRILHAQGLA